MKKYIYLTQLFFILLATIFLDGCKVIGEIFKAGMWSGILIVVLVIALILYLINRNNRK